MRLLVMVFWVLGLTSAAQADPRTISVTGEGVVTAVPDMAVLTLEVSEEAATATEALDTVAKRAQAVFERLEAFEIASRDMQTSALSLNPLWSRDRAPNEAPEIRGYRAETRVTVRLRDLGMMRGIFDKVVADGANGFGGLQFAVQDTAPLHEAARRAAVADAKARAALYAEAAGVTLGPVLSLSETGAATPRPMMMARAEMVSDGGMPVAAGEMETRALVSMVFAIEGGEE
ncbi:MULTISPECIES: SIMPL domain-containing protein [Shimia]|uniref:SIMPL domain-containing protein n=1 Tax=Shimia TaxID=573139 RepID=UPI001FB1A8EC|nr:MULTISPECIES: SIMPL domain-containing protein [Shimia]MDV4145345.1 SIMPL domain-containing protein [Shimia sp. FJ5]